MNPQDFLSFRDAAKQYKVPAATLAPVYYWPDKGVCKVVCHDVAIRRYLDALAHELMARAVGTP